MKAKGGAWGKVAVDKGTIWSDKIGVRVNDIAEKRFGTEAFYPVTGDFPKEMDKCARLLRAFTGMSTSLLTLEDAYVSRRNCQGGESGEVG